MLPPVFHLRDLYKGGYERKQVVCTVSLPLWRCRQEQVFVCFDSVQTTPAEQGSDIAQHRPLFVIVPQIWKTIWSYHYVFLSLPVFLSVCFWLQRVKLKSFVSWKRDEILVLESTAKLQSVIGHGMCLRCDFCLCETSSHSFDYGPWISFMSVWDGNSGYRFLCKSLTVWGSTVKCYTISGCNCKWLLFMLFFPL